MWYSIQVKDPYNTPSQYSVFKELLKDKLGLAEGEMYFPGNGGANPFGNYVFISLRNMECRWETIAKLRMVDASMGYDCITDDELNSMRSSEQAAAKNEGADGGFNYGDVVKITKGVYKRLYGVVLDGEGGGYDIGIRLFMGPRIIRVEKQSLEKAKSLFEIWKFKK